MYLERYPQERGKELAMSNIIELAKDTVYVTVNSEMGIGHPYKGLFISRMLADKIQRKFGLVHHEYIGVPDKRGIERYYLTGDDKNVEEAIAYALQHSAAETEKYSVVKLNNRWFAFDMQLARMCDNGNIDAVEDASFVRFWNTMTDPNKLDYCYKSSSQAFVPRREYWIDEISHMAG